MRPAIWSGGRPVYCQTTPITGMRISGKMSVGVRSAASGPMIRSSSARTTNVYGLLSAIRTNAIINEATPGKAVIGSLKGQSAPADLPESNRNANAAGRRRPSRPRHSSCLHGRGRSRSRQPAALRRPHRIQELADFELEAVAVAGERLGRGEHLRRGRTGLAGAALHVGDVGGDLLGALSG